METREPGREQKQLTDKTLTSLSQNKAVCADANAN